MTVSNRRDSIAAHHHKIVDAPDYPKVGVIILMQINVGSAAYQYPYFMRQQAKEWCVTDPELR
jgi:hypothetical protein